MSQTSSGLHGQASIVTTDGVFQHAPLCGDFEIEIDRHGTWYYCNSPIGRPALVKLFASILRRVGDEYWLVTPVEQGRIVVADVPFVAVAVTVAGMGRERVLSFRTNLDEWVTAGPEHPIWVDIAPETGEPRPYIEVRAGLAARIARPVYYELAELAEPRPVRPDSSPDASGETMEDEMAEYGVWSKGRFFLLA